MIAGMDEETAGDEGFVVLVTVVGVARLMMVVAAVVGVVVWERLRCWLEGAREGVDDRKG